MVLPNSYNIKLWITMMENNLYEKSYAFAIRIVKAYKFLNDEKREFILSKQLLKVVLV